jgi:hypothetical protein
MSLRNLFVHSISANAPEIFADREVALQSRAKRHQYAGKSTGELAQIAEELCLSAVRIKRFDTLGSHLFELEAQAKRKTFGDD